MSFYEVTENKRARAEKHLHVRYCPFARRPAVTPSHHNPILDTLSNQWQLNAFKRFVKSRKLSDHFSHAARLQLMRGEF